MAFLTLTSLTLKTPDLARTLVSDLTLNFGSERTGVVGRNGCGKSSLLNVLAAQSDPAGGVVSRAGRVGLLRQRFDDLSIPIFEALDVAVALQANARVVAGHGRASDLAAVDWALDARIDSALGKVGLGKIAPDTPLSQLSGGQRMRVSIARAVLEDADLLLLDEPTNNLDGQGRAMISDLVSGWRGGVVVAGHDSTLLEQMDRMLELSSTGARLYVGGWSAYRAHRDADAAQAQADLDRASQALKNTHASVQRQQERKARRDKAGRARRAQDNEPRVALDRQQGRAEKTLGRDKHLADQMVANALVSQLDMIRVVPCKVFDAARASIHA